MRDLEDNFEESSISKEILATAINSSWMMTSGVIVFFMQSCRFLHVRSKTITTELSFCSKTQKKQM